MEDGQGYLIGWPSLVEMGLEKFQDAHSCIVSGRSIEGHSKPGHEPALEAAMFVHEAMTDAWVLLHIVNDIVLLQTMFQMRRRAFQRRVVRAEATDDRAGRL